MLVREKNNLSRALLVAAALAFGSGAAKASTLTVDFTVTEVTGLVTSATLNLDSSVVSNLATYTGTLVSSTAGDLNNNGTDSTIVTHGSDGATFNLVDSHIHGNSFNPLAVTTIVLNAGAVTSITLSGQINGSGGGWGNGVLDGSTDTEIIADNPWGTVDADLHLPDPPAATPLPAAFPLFAGGLGLMGLFARSRKRKSASRLATA
jgi:hypothetical protein